MPYQHRDPVDNVLRVGKLVKDVLYTLRDSVECRDFMSAFSEGKTFSDDLFLVIFTKKNENNFYLSPKIARWPFLIIYT